MSITSSDSEYQCIAPIDFISMTKVPESHTWVLNPCDENLLESIPTIDLLDPNAISLIRHACEKWGIFHVINHGVSSQLLDEVELQTRGLFSLPFDQKLQAFRSANSISGYGTCRRSCLHPKRMWSEGFTIVESPKQDVHKLWPHDHHQRNHFCDVMVMYRNEMNKLAETLLDLMFGSLGLTQEDTKQVKPKTGLKNPYGPLQLNSYPICPDPTKAMGLAAHTDTSLLTLLYQSNTPTSLQIFKEGIGWVPVHPLNGALIVNLGDLMQILSNGRFKSVLHRAVVNNTHHRISVANFYGPPNDVKLSPLIQLGNLDHLPLYRSVTWKEYLKIKAKHNTKALEFIKN
ncbi:gibberellin 3-beta-dioxygenase 1 [Cannabis sativa]|uniref:gibberellin 3-beta-dioxygenase 1 n=1 Tax=Cannabis sativa TaxID=3483 RepID=UPI0029C9E686|nr:gibberellin 3-beta-dioxygenase 1 [Cannabis sativa]